MYFHTDDPVTVEFLARVLDLASLNQQRVRIQVNEDGSLQIKRGESVWTAPFQSTPDPYRDNS